MMLLQLLSPMMMGFNNNSPTPKPTVEPTPTATATMPRLQGLSADTFTPSASIRSGQIAGTLKGQIPDELAKFKLKPQDRVWLLGAWQDLPSEAEKREQGIQILVKLATVLSDGVNFTSRAADSIIKIFREHFPEKPNTVTESTVREKKPTVREKNPQTQKQKNTETKKHKNKNHKNKTKQIP
jgi:hypothetical protein